MISETLQNKLDTIPTNPGVYQYKDADGRIIYVGKAKNLRNRVRSYFQSSRNLDAKTVVLVSKIADVELIVTDNEIESLILEQNLIKKFKPRYNVVMKDDKSYPFIVITKEPYPRIFVTRKIFHDGSKYFGPYTDVKNMRESLKLIRELFRVRSCNFFLDAEVVRKKKVRLCLDYHIKKCDGPCEGLISEEQYNALIDQAKQVLKGKSVALVHQLETEMEKLSQAMQYEEAAEVRDRVRGLLQYAEKQKVVDTDLSDRDVFALAIDGDDACGVIFKIREGKILGKRHYYLSNVEGKGEPEIVEQLMERYYLEADYIPEEIFLPTEIENEETICKWLNERRAESKERGVRSVEIVVPKIGDKAKLIAMCATNAKLLLQDLKLQKEKQKDFIPHSLRSLQRDLRLPKPPRRIECFDNSNIQGSDAVASMVVFVDGKPKKSEYRKFKIKTVVGADDFASMKEVVFRRYKRVLEENLALPDLIVIDGGKGQLSSAITALNELQITNYELRITNYELPITNGVTENWSDGVEKPQIPNRKPLRKESFGQTTVIGLAKRLEEIFLPNESEAILLPKTSSSLKLLQQIRDEAHRFAVAFHRLLREKRTLQTELDLIHGIGKKRAKELLEVFGSVQGVKFATEEQLAGVVGEKVASTIKEYFEVEAVETH
ncbi:MAG: excinuclease ABC subunit C [Ignavibacteriales bacterium]|nr:excinuclease ABC subunit C [Ignavibacteriales bacterium]